MTPVSKLPVWRTVLDSWRMVLARAPGLLRVAWLPAILAAELEASVYLIVPEPAGLLARVLVIFVTAIPLTVLLVPWYRTVLLDENPVGGAPLWRMQTPHIRFLWRWVLLAGLPPIILRIFDLAVASESPALKGAGLLLMVSASVGLSYIFCRMALVLPAAAIDQLGRLDRAWRLSKGNGWRLLGICWLAVLPLLLLVASLGAWELGRPPAGDNSALVLIVLSIASVFNILIGTTARALCYRALGGMDGGEKQPIPEH